jgi:hypothetical protein
MALISFLLETHNKYVDSLSVIYRKKKENKIIFKKITLQH